MAGRIHSVNLAVITEAVWAGAPSGRSGIDKRPVDGPVTVTAEGLAGDMIADRRHHGGPDKAVYAYAREDAAWWERELGRPVPPGRFGENLSTEGLDVTGAVIGERWLVGSAELEVSEPRTPCNTFVGFWDVPDLIRRFAARATPGAYLRVVHEGRVRPGDEVVVTRRPDHGLTIGETFRALHGATELLPRLLAAPQLPVAIQDRVRRRLATPTG